jgi:hypothetical protein
MSEQPNPYAPPATVEAPPPESIPDVLHGPRGIGGWLILPLLGLAGSLLQIGSALITVYVPMFEAGGGWEIVTDSSSPDYHPLWAPLLLFEIVTNLGFAGLIVVLLYLALKHSRRFPRLMIGYLAAGVIVAIVDSAWARSIPALATGGNLEGVTQVARTMVGALIWIPYFLLSVRVKNTFVKA